jgi:hypothetical protein
MALPPLELFSLKKRPPCCRVASSLFRIQLLGDEEREVPRLGEDRKKIRFDLEARYGAADAGSVRRDSKGSLKKEAHSMSHALHPMLQVMVALLTLAVLIWPSVLANDIDLDGDNSGQNHIP